MSWHDATVSEGLGRTESQGHLRPASTLCDCWDVSTQVLRCATLLRAMGHLSPTKRLRSLLELLSIRKGAIVLFCWMVSLRAMAAFSSLALKCPGAGSSCPIRYYGRGYFFFSLPLSWDKSKWQRNTFILVNNTIIWKALGTGAALKIQRIVLRRWKENDPGHCYPLTCK